MKDPLSADKCSDLLKALADPHRLHLIQALRERDQSVSDLAALLDMEIGNVSHHLKVLRQQGIVTFERDGKTMIYALSRELFNSDRSKSDRFDFGCCRLELPK
jgi:ArsR family transcriptional regulator